MRWVCRDFLGRGENPDFVTFCVLADVCLRRQNRDLAGRSPPSSPPRHSPTAGRFPRRRTRRGPPIFYRIETPVLASFPIARRRICAEPRPRPLVLRNAALAKGVPTRSRLHGRLERMRKVIELRGVHFLCIAKDKEAIEFIHELSPLSPARLARRLDRPLERAGRPLFP